LSAGHDLLASGQVQFPARGQVLGLQQVEREIWEIDPLFLISSGHSGSAGLLRTTSRRFTWNQTPQRRQLRVTITRFASKLGGALSFQGSLGAGHWLITSFDRWKKSALGGVKLLVWRMVCHSIQRCQAPVQSLADPNVNVDTAGASLLCREL
jgi:hypothetical protein